ncbi:MAG: SDR family NAD(P)-dependent oxidoreductase [Steroidobacteraceae bacterium]
MEKILDTSDRVVSLESFASPLRVLIWGASGGLGGAFVTSLEGHPRVVAVHAASRSAAEPWRFTLDDESSIAAVAAAAAAAGPLDLVLVVTGELRAPEKSWRALDGRALARAFEVNAIGPALIAKHTLGLLRRDSKAVFACLSAKVGSIEDNRLGGWHGYRASKAALNMLVRTLAIELRGRHPQALCLALHPGTVATELSRPFSAAIDPARILSPEVSAAHLLRLIDRLGPEASGQLWSWDGTRLPF